MPGKKTPPAAMTRKSSINEARIAGLYDLEHTIGKGHFAVVKLARHCFTGEKVAAKVIDKLKLDPISQAHMMQEVRCMKLVQHPNIVRLYEVIDTSTKLFLILELGDYDMYEFIMKNEHKGIKESEAQQYFSQIIKAIDYCHTLHVVHRDLKPENVVFFEKLGMVKLTDFGFSNLFTPGQQLSTACGSMAYSAPEILLGDAYDAPAVDVWSLGVILYMLVCARLPFQETNESETLTKILDCKYTIPEHVSASCKTLIARMLVRDPVLRATLTEITQSTWVVAGDRGHAEVLPLIAKDHLPESAHSTIIDQMVAGGIASEEQIVSAIDNDDYNYITATYYLLAERVLASYRELQASRLIPTVIDAVAGASSVDDNVIVDCEPSTSTSAGSVGFRARSRSNSWRGSTSRRACTILKEESEEELSSYLRSPSRQSSRTYTISKEPLASSRASRSSRASSLERDCGGSASNALVADAVARLLGPIPKELSSIRELGEMPPVFGLPEEDEEVSDERPTSLQLDMPLTASRRRGHRIMRHSMSLDGCPEDDSEDLDDRPASSQRTVSPAAALPRTPSAPSTFFSSMARKRLFRPTLLRRNSSPSVSMFAGSTTLHSSRDRISPQAIHDLLEFSRLSGGMRRAASPESRISSRSPSPCSSGRTSPAITGSFIRLKVSGGPAASGTGMRKLSSSPHLLGICEESEDSPDTSLLNLSAPRSVSTISTQKAPHISRGNRSASVGLGSLPISFLPLKDSKEKTSKAPPPPPLSPSAKTGASSSSATPASSYSSMRVIRPRQAVVSPDMVRRYESHQRLVARTRRSTSCSSSETSDDDSNERKLSLIGTRYCRRGPDDRGNDDDACGGGGGGGTSGGGGGAVGPRRSNSMKEQTIIEEPSNTATGGGDATAVAHNCLQAGLFSGGLTPESPSSLSFWSESDASVYGKIPGTPLQPILEDETGGMPLFSQSEALMDWVQESQSYCANGGPSPDDVPIDSPLSAAEFYRTLRRSKSLDDPALHLTVINQQDCDSLNVSTSSCNLTPAEGPHGFDEVATDSGCPSDDECRRTTAPTGKGSKFVKPASWFTELTNRVFHELHRRTGISAT